MKRYMVTYPYVYHEVICDDGSGPDYDEALVGLIEAENPSKAKAIMLRMVKKHSNVWEPSDNPFTRMTCERLCYFESKEAFDAQMVADCELASAIDPSDNWSPDDIGSFEDNIQGFAPYTNIATPKEGSDPNEGYEVAR